MTRTAESITVQHDSTSNVLIYEISVPDEDVKTYAKRRVSETWSEDQWSSFNYIISKESHDWRVTGPHNPALSSAYGLGGFLDSTWKSVGCVKTDDSKTQIDCTIKYIENRYGTPFRAYHYHLANNHY